LSAAELDAMVDALSQEAQKQGLTARDITWRPAPQNEANPVPTDTCGAMLGGLRMFRSPLNFSIHVLNAYRSRYNEYQALRNSTFPRELALSGQLL